MTDVRTFFWHDRIKGRASLFLERHVLRKETAWKNFAIGNAGDIFARNLMNHFYPEATPLNCNDGPRILAVGSIGHKLQAGDVLSGIGCKSTDLPRLDPATVHVHAVRGPISLGAFKSAGYDVSGVTWMTDPGLLIAKMVTPAAPQSGNVVFIPHYRERKAVANLMPAGMTMIDIDDEPLSVANKIMRAELVYTSSLHGAVFSHALQRPVVLVKPRTEEPTLKYEDYYLSVGLDKPKMLDSIEDAKFANAPTSPASLSINIDDIVFPTEDQLRERGILR